MVVGVGDWPQLGSQQIVEGQMRGRTCSFIEGEQIGSLRLASEQLAVSCTANVHHMLMIIPNRLRGSSCGCNKISKE